MTLIDECGLRERPAPNCRVQVGIDADAAFDVVVQAIASFSR